MINFGDTLLAKDPDGTLRDIGAFYYDTRNQSPILKTPVASATNVPLNPVFSWNSIATASSYRLQVCTNQNFDSAGMVTDTTIYVGKSFPDTSCQARISKYFTWHYWRITAYFSTSSPIISAETRMFRTKLAPPNGIAVSSLSSSQNRLMWVQVDSAQEYVILRGLDSISVNRKDTISASPYLDTVVVPGTKYFYRLLAIKGVSEVSDSSARVNIVTIPSKPKALVVFPQTDNSMTLHWQIIGLASKFIILRGGDSLNFLAIDTTKDTSYTNCRLLPRPVYWYRIVALNCAGVHGDTSDRASDTTYRVLPRITAIKLDSVIQSKNIRLICSVFIPPLDTARLQFFISIDSGKTYSVIDSASIVGKKTKIALTFVDTLTWNSLISLATTETKATRIKIQPLGRDSNGVALQSSIFTLDNLAPRFTGIDTVLGDTNRVLIRWKRATDLTGPITYKVYQDTVANRRNFRTPIEQVVGDTSVVIAPLSNFRTYYFVVLAQDSVGNVDTTKPQKSGMPTALPSADSARVIAGGVQSHGVKVQYTVSKPLQDTVTMIYQYSVDGGPFTRTTNVVSSGGLAAISHTTTTNGVSNGGSATISQASDVFKRDINRRFTIGIVPGTVGNKVGKMGAVKNTVAVPPSGGLVVASMVDTATWQSEKDCAVESKNVRFRVIPQGLGGQGIADTTSIFTLDNLAPRFTGIDTVLGDTNRVLIRWKRATDLTGPITYKVYQDTVANRRNFRTPIEQVVGDTSVVIAPLSNFRTYYFVVLAQDSVGNVDTTKPQKSGMPTALPSADSARVIAGGVQSHGVKVQYTVSKPLQDTVTMIYQYSVDGRPFTRTTNVVSSGGLAAISHTTTTNGVSNGGSATISQASDVFKRDINRRFTIGIVPGTVGNKVGKMGAVKNTVAVPPSGGLVVASMVDTATWQSEKDCAVESKNVRFRVIPQGLGGQGIADTTSIFTLDNLAPRFTGIDTVLGDTNRVLIRWKRATDLTGPITYKVYQDTVANRRNFRTPIEQVVGDTSVVIAPLSNFRTYYFVVLAQDSVGNVDTTKPQKSGMPTALPSADSARVIAGGVQSHGVKVQYTVSKPLQDTVTMIYQYSVDGGPFTRTTNVVSSGGLAAISHTTTTNGVSNGGSATISQASDVFKRDINRRFTIGIVPGTVGNKVGKMGAVKNTVAVPPSGGLVVASMVDTATWQSEKDCAVESKNVRFRVIPQGLGGQGIADTTSIFTLDNLAPRNIDGSNFKGIDQATWDTARIILRWKRVCRSPTCALRGFCSRFFNGRAVRQSGIPACRDRFPCNWKHLVVAIKPSHFKDSALHCSRCRFPWPE